MKLDCSVTTFVLIAAPLFAAAAHTDLSTKYPFHMTLFNDQGQYYGLYWNFSIAAKTIHFAVNVSTGGWVGFGVSPTGQMPRSDVVIGWVADSGKIYFHDRFADGRSLPPIDESQDWFLISGEEEQGFTVLEFSRNLTTCDSRDLDIKPDTTRVIWSFSTADPPSDQLGETANRHNFQGSVSVNLLNGLVEQPAEPDDLQYFDVVVTNITIPTNDTTYWCHSIEIGEDFEASTRYIIRTSPVITPHARSFVHHMLIYLCPYALSESLVGESGPCRQVHQNVSGCRNGNAFGAWAVGGEDFTYPENVAYPIGGPGAGRHIVIEMHYDNPKMEEGVVDSSGMRFYYTSVRREYDAGMVSLGHYVSSTMVIPPQATNYTISGLCTSTCTKKYLPESGIHVFAIFLHTHLAGRALELQHFRQNPDCGVLEELEPIVFNPTYDFNYQQFMYLPREVTILPGDVLVSRCIYGTKDRTEVTFGGLSTREEMCLITPVFYPYSNAEPNLLACISGPVSPYTFQPFEYRIRARNPEVSALWDQGRIVEGLNAIDWSSDTIQDLEKTVTTGLTAVFCATENDYFIDSAPKGIPEPACSYQAPDKCTSFQPTPCCERLQSGAAKIMTQMNFLTVSFSLFISVVTAAVAL